MLDEPIQLWLIARQHYKKTTVWGTAEQRRSVPGSILGVGQNIRTRENHIVVMAYVVSHSYISTKHLSNVFSTLHLKMIVSQKQLLSVEWNTKDVRAKSYVR